MSTTVSDDNSGLFYDVDKDKKLLEFFNRGNKLKTTEKFTSDAVILYVILATIELKIIALFAGNLLLKKY